MNVAIELIDEVTTVRTSATDVGYDEWTVSTDPVEIVLDTSPALLPQAGSIVTYRQIRTVRSLVGPYKGANFGARKRPGSPVLDLNSDPWLNIDLAPDDLDVNHYGENGIPDYAADEDPLDPDSPVRG